MIPPNLLRSNRVAATLVFALAAQAGCASSTPPVVQAGAPEPEPVAPRELRGVFVTTAYNIDWPSKPGLHWRVQRDEIKAIVRRVRELNCNVIFLQVRAFGDRMHRSTTLPAEEPWAAALNHRRDPDPHAKKYDPLGVWIQECHEAGIELHAWVNPFRVDTLIELKQPNKPQPTTLPFDASEDGNHMYLDVNSSEVRDYVLKVIGDLLSYKANPSPGGSAQETGSVMHILAAGGGEEGVDGLIFDHFPYPRRPATQPRGIEVSPDGAAGLADNTAVEVSPQPGLKKPPSPRIKWLLKKANVPQPSPNPAAVGDFMKAVSGLVGQSHAKFGYSPLCDDADAKGWLKEGLFNYVIPELYFKTAGPRDFSGTLQSWVQSLPGAGAFKPIVVVGLFSMRVQSPAPGEEPWPADEILEQITQSDQVNPGNGHAHYSWFALRSPGHGGPADASQNLGDLLMAGRYKTQALVPQCTVAPAPQLSEPKVTFSGGKATWTPAPGEAKKVFVWAVWQHDANGWRPMQVFPASASKLTDIPAGVDRLAVAAVDRYNQLGRTAKIP